MLTDELKATIVRMRQEGKSYNEVAEATGKTLNSVKKWCQANGHGGWSKNDPRDVQALLCHYENRLFEKYKGEILYSDGYTNMDSEVTLLCTKCSNPFVVIARNALKDRCVGCPDCARENAKEQREQKEEAVRRQCVETKLRKREEKKSIRISVLKRG